MFQTHTKLSRISAEVVPPYLDLATRTPLLRPTLSFFVISITTNCS